MKTLKAYIEEVEKEKAPVAEEVEESPVQEEIEDRVEDEKEELEDFLPKETNEAMNKSINTVGFIAKKLFSKNASLTKEARKKLAERIKAATDEFYECGEDCEFCKEDGGIDESYIPEDSTKAASKIAGLAKKMIVAKEKTAMKFAKLKVAEEIVDLAQEIEEGNEENSQVDEAEDAVMEARLASAESLVKLAKKILALKHEPSMETKKYIASKITRIAKNLEAIGDEYEVEKTELLSDFNKSNKHQNKKLNVCVDWKALQSKNTSVNIKPTTLLKDITLEDLRKIMTTLKGVN